MILQRVALYPQERLDLPDVRAIEAFGQNDWRFFISGILSSSSYVIAGFEVTNYSNIFTIPGVKLELDNVALIHPEATTQASGFYVSAGNEADEQLVLSPSATNYVEVDLSASTGTPDVRAFWDPGANGGQGVEFSDTVDTVINLNLNVLVNVSGFTSGRIPLYKIVTNSSGVVTTITDCRPLFFRLGTGGTSPDPKHNFTFPSLPDSAHASLETPVASVSATAANAPYQGGDKNLKSYKDWMDAMMSGFKKLKATPYWYIPTLSIPESYQNAAAIILSGGTWEHISGTPGHLKLISGSLMNRLGKTNNCSLTAFSDISLIINPVLYLLLPQDSSLSYGMGEDGSSPVAPQSVTAFDHTTITVGTGGNYIESGGNLLLRGQTFSYDAYSSATGTFSGVSPDPAGLCEISDYVYQDNDSVGYYHVSASDAYPGVLDGVSHGAERAYWLAMFDGSNTIHVNNGDLIPGEDVPVGGGTSTETLAYIGATSASDSSPVYGVPNLADGTNLTAALIEAFSELNLITPIVVPTSSSNPSFSWNGSALSITDSNGSPAGTDVIGKIRNYGSSQTLSLFRQDGTGSTSAITIPSGSVLYVKIPTSGDRSYSGIGAGSTNYQVATRASFFPNNSNYWLAYNENGNIILRSGVVMYSGDSYPISSSVSNTLLGHLGLSSETAAPSYSSDVRGTANESLVARIGKLTAAVGDYQEDRFTVLRSDSTVSWSGTQLTFTSDLILHMIAKRDATASAGHTYTIPAGTYSPLSLNSGEFAYINIDRTTSTSPQTLSRSSLTTFPVQTQANKDTFILFYRLDASGVGYLYLPFMKQLIAPGQSVRLGQAGANTGSGSGTGDDLDSLTYRASFRDTFDTAPSTAGPIDITSGHTDSSTYNAGDQYYRLAYDASKLLTAATSTTMRLNSVSSVTFAVGDIVVFGTEARRITVLGSLNSDGGTATPFTIESAFATNPSASACCVSKCVYTVDLNAHAGDGMAIGTAITDTISSALLDYSDTSTADDTILDTGTANIACTASSDGSSYSPVVTRTSSLMSQMSAISLPTSGSNLYLRFFANKTSGTGSVNLLDYKVFFHRQNNADSTTFLLNQAYCLTDGTGTQINCSAPTVVSSKTTVVLNYTYIPGLNPGTANGQLEVFINGQKIPRFVSGATSDAYYTEVNGNTIALDSDYSGFNFSLEIVKTASAIDASQQNALRLTNLYDAIVGSSAQVTSGQATHTSLTSALAAVSAGSKILILNITTTENVTISQNVVIEGRGHTSILNGTLTFASGSDYSLVRDLKVGDNVTFNSGPTGIYFTHCWLASGKTLTDNSTGNYKLWITE